jgi:hypothetical protein
MEAKILRKSSRIFECWRRGSLPAAEEIASAITSIRRAKPPLYLRSYVRVALSPEPGRRVRAAGVFAEEVQEGPELRGASAFGLNNRCGTARTSGSSAPRAAPAHRRLCDLGEAPRGESQAYALCRGFDDEVMVFAESRASGVTAIARPSTVNYQAEIVLVDAKR